MSNDVGLDDGGRPMFLSHCRAAFPGAARTPNLAGAGRRARICIRRLRGVRRAVTFWHQAPRLHNMRIRIPYGRAARLRSEEHTSEVQSLMRISYAVLCLKKKNYTDLIMTPIHKT